MWSPTGRCVRQVVSVNPRANGFRGQTLLPPAERGESLGKGRLDLDPWLARWRAFRIRDMRIKLPRRYPDIAPSLATLVALALLAAVLAHWTWVFLAPPPAPSLSARPTLPTAKLLAERIALRAPFGGESEQTLVETMAGADPAPMAAPANYQLRGVYAPRRRGGFAIIQVDNQSLAAVTGIEFAPGAILESVGADHVMIRRGGQLERLRLPELATSSTPAGENSKLTASRLVVHQLGPGNYGLSRAEVMQALKTPQQLARMGRFGMHPRGGVALEDSPPGGLSDRLGLKVGDTIMRVNGKPMRSPADAARIYDYLLTNEKVNLEWLRGGRRMTMTIQIYP